MVSSGDSESPPEPDWFRRSRAMFLCGRVEEYRVPTIHSLPGLCTATGSNHFSYPSASDVCCCVVLLPLCSLALGTGKMKQLEICLRLASSSCPATPLAADRAEFGWVVSFSFDYGFLPNARNMYVLNVVVILLYALIFLTSFVMLLSEWGDASVVALSWPAYEY